MAASPSPDDKSAHFALIGVAGFVAPRHLRAIRDTGNQLIAAVDPHDSVGILDQYFPQAKFFTEIERFDRFLEKVRRRKDVPAADYLSICSPNYLHDAHVRLALRVGAHAICEKPLVINPWNLDALAELEKESGRRVYTVLQLRLHPALCNVKSSIDRGETAAEQADITLTYVTARGAWYGHSWKGSTEKSGGVVMNIGIHFFDVLLWLFGSVEHCAVHLLEHDRAAGYLQLERARVRWLLSVNEQDLPDESRRAGQSAYRSIDINDEQVDFSTGLEDLHTRLYADILAGRGFGIEEARPSIDLVHRIRNSEIVTPGPSSPAHPSLSVSRRR